VLVFGEPKEMDEGGRPFEKKDCTIEVDEEVDSSDEATSEFVKAKETLFLSFSSSTRLIKKRTG